MRVRPGAAGVALLGLALAASALMWVVQPLSSGYSYGLGVQATAILLAVWVGWWMRPSPAHLRVALPAVAVVGTAVGVARLRGLDPGAEVVRTYHSVFEALAAGRNPYTCGCIVHETPYGDRLGDFNYPPGEIWPYQAVHAIVGNWDAVVLATTAAALNALAFVLLLSVTPPGRRLRALALLPVVVLWELRTTVGMTVLVTAAIVAVLVLQERAPRGWHRPALWVLFGVGLLTKFAVIPLFAVWWWWTAVRRARAAPPEAGAVGRLRALAPSAPDALVPVAIALALCLPVGVVNVVRSTLLFNVELDRRAELTTFYPNGLSGLATWAGAQALYSLLAVAVLGAAVLVAARVPLLAGMLMVTTVFLLVSPTPEPQYVPLVSLLLLAALAEREGLHAAVAAGGAAPAGRAAVLEMRRAGQRPRMSP